ncbi:FHA domain protein [Selenomonas sp. oral taxon 892 str. F0426]|jgi:FHA domain protein|uniref:FHA domain-containing protein n=1 Tax=Selenomonas sp. oral taxon 892 TaxID=1321785 RepID=UPI0003ACFDFE|nr:FHA domain-containing protein [Selenomonas sp. oral taxon 892]ERJ89523.1 FHA domain protein [Selenomonas sp. oral taxon 892 str. F0426]
MPAVALKALRVLLEYGALLWLAYVVFRLGGAMFQTMRTDLREAGCKPQQSFGTAFLVAIAGEDIVGQRFPIGYEISIGRSTDNDIVLADNFVSHHHLLIYQRENTYIAEDLGSRNHTYLNDRILTGRAYLRTGDVLRIGAAVLRFER